MVKLKKKMNSLWAFHLKRKKWVIDFLYCLILCSVCDTQTLCNMKKKKTDDPLFPFQMENLPCEKVILAQLEHLHDF